MHVSHHRVFVVIIIAIMYSNATSKLIDRNEALNTSPVSHASVGVLSSKMGN